MYLKNQVIKHLTDSIDETYQKIGKLSKRCNKHNLVNHPEADACPCQVKLYWQLDRLDESIHRLKTKDSVVQWGLWYLRSSSKNPGFPKKSITGWSQSGQPIAAWEKYEVAQRNSQAGQNSQRAYTYDKNGREHSSRPAAVPY